MFSKSTFLISTILFLTQGYLFSQCPFIVAGDDISACKEIESIPLDGFIQRGFEGKWSSNGTGSFSDVLIQNPVYTLSERDRGKELWFAYAIAPTEACPQGVSDTTFLKFKRYHEIDLTDTLFTCTTQIIISSDSLKNSKIASWTSLGTGRFLQNEKGFISYWATRDDSLRGKMKIIVIPKENEGCKGQGDTLNLSFVKKDDVNASIKIEERPICGATKVRAILKNTNTFRWSIASDLNFVSLEDSFIYQPNEFAIQNKKDELVLTYSSIGCGEKRFTKEIAVNAPILQNIIAARENFEKKQISLTLVTRDNLLTQDLQWLSTGKGTFSDIQKMTATYNYNDEEIEKGVIEIIAKANNKDFCGPEEIKRVIPIKGGYSIPLLLKTDIPRGTNGKKNYKVMLYEQQANATYKVVKEWIKHGETEFLRPIENGNYIVIASPCMDSICQVADNKFAPAPFESFPRDSLFRGTVTINNNDSEPINIAFAEATKVDTAQGTIKGKVFWETIVDSVSIKTNLPVYGAVVLIYNRLGQLIGHSITDKEGIYRMNHINRLAIFYQSVYFPNANAKLLAFEKDLSKEQELYNIYLEDTPLIVTANEGITHFDNILVMPIPTDAVCFVKNLKGASKISIYSTLGERVLLKETNTEQEIALETAHLATGIYTIAIESKGKIQYKKLVISR